MKDESLFAYLRGLFPCIVSRKEIDHMQARLIYLEEVEEQDKSEDIYKRLKENEASIEDLVRRLSYQAEHTKTLREDVSALEGGQSVLESDARYHERRLNELIGRVK